MADLTPADRAELDRAVMSDLPCVNTLAVVERIVAAARADEREKAAQRIEALVDGDSAHVYVLGIEDAAQAAREVTP